MIDPNIGRAFEFIVNWMTDHWEPFFDALSGAVTFVVEVCKWILLTPPALASGAVAVILAWLVAGRGVGLFTLVGFVLIGLMGFWVPTMETLALVITSVFIALLVGLPLGIWASKNDWVEAIVRPILDFMQTLPAFVYLIPAVLFFSLGEVPGVIATLIFSLPPAVRLTNLGIRQVPKEIREAAQAFGSTPQQMLFKAELPTALPTIMAGVNQTIMMALSMVVISGMIGAGGLGDKVLKGITQLDLDLGFEAGISIVILAIFLDRVTQALGVQSQKAQADPTKKRS